MIISPAVQYDRRIYLGTHSHRFFWVPEGVVFSGKRTKDAPARIMEIDPIPPLQPYIRCYYRMDWDLGEKKVPVYVVPSGCMNLVFETRPDSNRLRVKVVGVRHEAYCFSMTGKAAILGVQFTPGGFYPFYGKNVSELADRVIALDTLFPVDSEKLEAVAFADIPFIEKVVAWDAILARLIPEEIPKDLRWIHEVLAAISTDETFNSPGRLFERFGVHERTLQRLFQKYVGVSPRMWIRTKRFQDAAKRILAGKVVNWAALATELGYYDQAHFLNDFKSITGHRPSDIAQVNF